ncbi:Mce-associated membrane protein [Mycolicibacterium sp. 624]
MSHSTKRTGRQRDRQSTASTNVVDAPSSIAEPSVEQQGRDESIPTAAEPTGASDPAESTVAVEGVDNEASGCDETKPAECPRRRPVLHILIFTALPILAMLLASAAGYFKWAEGSARGAETAAAESVRAATDATIAMLSYAPDTVETQLGAARQNLTGDFKDAYTQLINDVVIPGAKQQRVTAVATVPAAAVISAEEKRVVVMLFVNQSMTVGEDPTASSTSAVRESLEKTDGRWLVSEFTPI